MVLSFSPYQTSENTDRLSTGNQGLLRDEPESAPQKGLYVNERYQHLKTKECQALLSPKGRQIFAQRKIDVEPVFGQIKACLGYKR